jgi:hypothetical protein
MAKGTGLGLSITKQVVALLKVSCYNCLYTLLLYHLTHVTVDSHRITSSPHQKLVLLLVLSVIAVCTASIGWLCSRRYC